MDLKPEMKIYFRGKVAYVIECINKNDPVDLRIQGRRWYIDSAGFRFSVTESELHEKRGS